MGWGTRKIGSSALTSTKKLGICAQSTCACGQIPPYCSWEREIASTQSRCGYVVRGVSTKLKFDDVGCLWNADCELACGTSIYSVKDIAAQHLSTNSTCLPATFFLGETGEFVPKNAIKIHSDERSYQARCDRSREVDMLCQHCWYRYAVPPRYARLAGDSISCYIALVRDTPAGSLFLRRKRRFERENDVEVIIGTSA